MLDPETFWNLERPGNKPSIQKIEHRPLDETELQLCNTWLPGFIMEHKKWGTYFRFLDGRKIKYSSLTTCERIHPYK